MMATVERQSQQFDTWNEILSQGRVWLTVLNELSQSAQVKAILERSSEQREWVFTGCGTSFYLAESAALTWTLLTGQTARALPASEIVLYQKLIGEKDPQIVVISRSGRTSEAVRAARLVKQELRLRTLGITCAENSELEQACDQTIVVRSADEKSTVMTRSFTSMLIGLQFLAARRAGNLKFVEDLHSMAEQFAPRVASMAKMMDEFVRNRSFADYVFLGQGPFHGIARETALKVMEMSCSYSQFFHTLEFRHGPKAIVSPATCLTFLLSGSGYKAETEVLGEMKELGAVNIAICNRAEEQTWRASDLVIEMNFDGSELALLAPYTVPCQLLGFFTGIGKGLNPDLPKNLTRVVILD
jgi:glutamine---fructose-6-phosphate transaminase (isomerizing)